MAVIAILGASGQIGRGLALELGRNPRHQLRLFTRRPDEFRATATALRLLRPAIDEVRPLDRLSDDGFDAIINAAGDGERAKQIALGAEIFRITEAIDAQVTAYLSRFPDTLYFFLSTGAVYGFDAAWPVRPDDVLPSSIAEPDPINFYPLAKLAAEARHRAQKGRIYDIRIFGYFSRFIPLGGSFFLSDLATAVVNHTTFRTTPVDMVRDYIDQAELAGLVEVFLNIRPEKGAYDVYSRAPVGKLELLKRLRRDFALSVSFEPLPTADPVHLPKPAAPTECRRAAAAGHTPRRTSIEIVTAELRALIDGTHRRA